MTEEKTQLLNCKSTDECVVTVWSAQIILYLALDNIQNWNKGFPLHNLCIMGQTSHNCGLHIETGLF